MSEIVEIRLPTYEELFEDTTSSTPPPSYSELVGVNHQETPKTSSNLHNILEWCLILLGLFLLAFIIAFCATSFVVLIAGNINYWIKKSACHCK
jgi:hypothetical protein